MGVDCGLRFANEVESNRKVRDRAEGIEGGPALVEGLKGTAMRMSALTVLRMVILVIALTVG